jgi:hypothetical protein
MALTLIEAAKLHEGDVLRQAIIEIYAATSDLLRVLPFESIAGNALRYNREETLPGIGFRGINEGYTESTGVLNPITESLVIAGGDLDVDKFILKTMGADQRAVHEAMKVKALSLAWTAKFLKGDSQTDPKEFDGLQARLGGNQVIANHATGGPLSLAKFDEAIDQCEDPNAIVTNKTIRRRLSAAARDTDVGGYITYDIDEFGRRVTEYNGLPLLIMDEDNAGNQILPFTEDAVANTSIYITSFGDGKLVGIQNGTPEVTDLGELEAKPTLRTRVEWYSGIAMFHGKSACRLSKITDAAVIV